MANSKTNYSKKLRSETAAKSNKAKIASGEYIQINITITKDDAIRQALDEAIKSGESKGKFVKRLLNEIA